MSGKTALVTGAARGLGKQIAHAMGRDGHQLFLVDILAPQLEETVAELNAAGYEVYSRIADISQRQQCLDAVADCLEATGNLTVLVNCAATLHMNRFVEIGEEEWNRTVAVNLSGPIFLMQAALPHIVAARGNIVNVASSNGLVGTAFNVSYSATKAALINVTKSLAMEYVDQPIRINAICPGPMRTDMTSGGSSRMLERDKILRYSGQRGFADPSTVADVVAFLASDAAASVHGAIWAADSGASAG